MSSQNTSIYGREIQVKVEKTPRGFELIHFKDLDKEDCSLQQSSIALYEQPGAGAIWFGIKDNRKLHLSPEQLEGLPPIFQTWLGPQNSRMHLSYEQVKELIPILQNWIDRNSFLPILMNEDLLHNKKDQKTGW